MSNRVWPATKGGVMKEERVSTKKELDFSELKTVRTDKEANDLLKAGWILLNAGVSHTDAGGYQAKCHFILGKRA
jgi:hypothetical protein